MRLHRQAHTPQEGQQHLRLHTKEEEAVNEVHSLTDLILEIATDLCCITLGIVDPILGTSISNTVSDALKTCLSLRLEFLLTNRGDDDMNM